MRDSALASVLFYHYAAVERGEQYVIAIKKAVEAGCFYCSVYIGYTFCFTYRCTAA
ncbi:hypothetical protein RQP50_02540 [Paenibacillus sp. chi10]|uniref:Uncharacterized protein n=1 Tax=Paenibacillus suaedae TaxID=3077233 RepID=A0AAJ2N0D1_9BACL|nr:hypothetical protein [Paenibacillus sp. chi10]MDT8975118.1 hypothetical protein [Paenibacillus sp. chi10]